MSQPSRIAELNAYQEASRIAAERKAELARTLGELVGKCVDISGYPSSAYFKTGTAPDSGKPCLTKTPVYGFSEPSLECEPRALSGSIVLEVTGRSLLAAIPSPDVMPADIDERFVAFAYEYPFDRLISLALSDADS